MQLLYIYIACIIPFSFKSQNLFVKRSRKLKPVFAQAKYIHNICSSDLNSQIRELAMQFLPKRSIRACCAVKPQSTQVYINFFGGGGIAPFIRGSRLTAENLIISESNSQKRFPLFLRVRSTLSNDPQAKSRHTSRPEPCR